MALLRPFPQPKSLEDAFLERYDVLLRVALAITGGRREAEDLVQDAFVRLMLSPPDLEAIVHLDAYLKTVLRNLHTARLRRRASSAEALSITDFDAAPFAARALTPSQWTQARHDVAAACRYACTRRLTSKTGSVFLLRFVHEFVPSDIALIARLARATVDVTLDRARAEVKTYLERPAHAIKALGRELVPMSLPAVEPGVDDGDDYLALVRAAVFALRHKRCFDAAQLRQLYAPTHEASIPMAIPMPILAELVTCQQCLDEVSRLLRLPPCAERHPGAAPPPLREGDAARRDRPRHTGSARRAAAAQRCRLVRAHRPRVLRMLINGFEIGSHEINGAAARITQTLSILEPVWLAEVYSEQDVCLASLDVTPLPEAPAEQRVDVALSDDRRIALVLSLLKPWPTLHLVYEEPAGAAPAFSAETADVEAEATDTPAVGAPAIGPAWSLTTRSLKHVVHAWRDWLRGTLGRPPRLAWWAAMILIAGWLFCFTPGTQVSAAERLWHAITALFTREPGPISESLPMPPGGPRRQQNISLAAPTEPRPPAAARAAPLTPDALAELEIDALIVLHGRGALAGQRIQVTRSSTRVAVEGLVEGPDRDEIVRALREAPHGDALLVRLSTPADLASGDVGLPRPRGSRSSNLRAVTLGRDAIPAADDLRQALARRAAGSATNAEAEVHRLANEGLQGARTGFLEAALLSTLTDRFAALSGPAMAETTTNKWRGLLAGQTDRVAHAVDQVRTLLEPVFVSSDRPPAPGAAPPIEDPPIKDPLSLADAARRLADDLGQVERATRAALTVAETPPDTIELRDAAFWRRLAATRARVAALKRQLVER